MPANTLRHWRTKRGWDVFELARQANVSDRLIRKIESEHKTYILKSDTMQQIADALELPVFAIFFQTDMTVMNSMMQDLVLRNINRMLHKSSLVTSEELFNMHLQQKKAVLP